MDQLELLLLGTPQLTRNGIPIHIGRRKAFAFLAYLAFSDYAYTRDHLAAFFWPGNSPHQAKAELRRILHALRKILGDSLTSNYETIFIPNRPNLYVDVRDFQHLIESWEKHDHALDNLCMKCLKMLIEADTIYRDDFLAGFSLADGGEFDAWQTMKSQILRAQLSSALKWLAQCLSYQDQVEKAISYARHLVRLDPFDELSQILLIQLYAKNGQRAAAIQQYQECEKILRTELGIAPQAETNKIFHTIINQQLIENVETLSPKKTNQPEFSPNHNLPFQAIPFVGREKLLDEIEQLLIDPNCRLLTLAGPGGCGKSRLGIEIGRKNLPRYPDGVYFVRLSSCETENDIVSAIARVIGMDFFNIKPQEILLRKNAQNLTEKQQLFGNLHNKSMLLILDNFEQLLNNMDLIVDLLEAAPQIQLLVTSRVRLNALAEYLYEVPGLDLPRSLTTIAAVESPEKLMAYGAVRFFVQCAQMKIPGFQLNKKNQASILHICSTMRGMPLGILLVTAWLAILEPHEICTKLDQNFDFLDTNLYGLPERQRSMRAIFNQTWKLLSEHEQTILQSLAVFQGGFSEAAVQFVSGATLIELRKMMDMWLIEQDQQQGRYRLHELLKQYLTEKLAGNADLETTVRNRHLKFYIDYLYQQTVILDGAKSQQALAAIDLEIENIRNAWTQALNQKNLESLESALHGLFTFYELCAKLKEGETVFYQAYKALEKRIGTNLQEAETQLLLGKILVRLGLFYGMQGLGFQSNEMLQKGVNLLQDSSDQKELAYALNHLAKWQQPVEAGRELHEKALAIFTDLDDHKGIALAKTGLAFTALSQGQFLTAHQLFQESLAIHQMLMNQRETAYSLDDISYVHWIMGDFPEALRYAQNSLELMEKLTFKPGIANATNHLGIAYCGMKEHTKSKEAFRKSYEIQKEIGNLSGIAITLSNLAEYALFDNDDREAFKLIKESYPYYQSIDEELKNANWYFRILGESECGLGYIQDGKRNLRKALQNFIAADLLAQTTHILVSIARYFEQTGEISRAYELLGLVMNHPGSWQWVKERAVLLTKKFSKGITTEEMQEALERGQRLDLEKTVQSLLVELREE